MPGGRAVSEWCPQSLIAVDCLGVPNEIKDECVGAGQWPVDAARCTLLCTPRPGYNSRPWPRATLPLRSNCSWHLLLYSISSRICSRLLTIRSTPLPYFIWRSSLQLRPTSPQYGTSPVTLFESDIVLQANSINRPLYFFTAHNFTVHNIQNRTHEIHLNITSRIQYVQ